jgi:hypothetical protein
MTPAEWFALHVPGDPPVLVVPAEHSDGYDVVLRLSTGHLDRDDAVTAGIAHWQRLSDLERGNPRPLTHEDHSCAGNS